MVSYDHYSHQRDFNSNRHEGSPAVDDFGYHLRYLLHFLISGSVWYLGLPEVLPHVDDACVLRVQFYSHACVCHYQSLRILPRIPGIPRLYLRVDRLGHLGNRLVGKCRAGTGGPNQRYYIIDDQLLLVK